MIPGVAGFVRKLIQWCQLTAPSPSQKETVSDTLADFYENGLHKHLTRLTLPLDMMELRTVAKFTKEVKQALKLAQDSFAEHRERV